MSTIEATKLSAFLAETGWTIVRAVDPSGADIAESGRSVAFTVATPG